MKVGEQILWNVTPIWCSKQTFGEEIPEYRTRTEEKAGSIVLTDDATAAKKMLESNCGDIKGRRRNQKTCRGEKNHAQTGETTIERSKQTKMHQGQERKERKDRKKFNRYSKTSNGLRTSQESNLHQEEFSSPSQK